MKTCCLCGKLILNRALRWGSRGVAHSWCVEDRKKKKPLKTGPPCKRCGRPSRYISGALRKEDYCSTFCYEADNGRH